MNTRPRHGRRVTPPLTTRWPGGYCGYMKTQGAVAVGVRELKNRLAAYLKLVKSDREVIVTERGKPIAIIQGVGSATGRTLESRVAALAARGEVAAPEHPLRRRVRRAKVGGPKLSETIVADRR